MGPHVHGQRANYEDKKKVISIEFVAKTRFAFFDTSKHVFRNKNDKKQSPDLTLNKLFATNATFVRFVSGMFS